ncbi:MAG: hypothetical protein ACXWDO_02160 [Bacteroidia bacterium]
MAKAAPKKGNSIPEWLTSPFSMVFSAAISVFAIGSIGYGIGSYISSQNCDDAKKDFAIEKMQMKLEFDEKLQKEIKDCQEYKLTNYQKSVENLQNVVNELSKKQNGK